MKEEYLVACVKHYLAEVETLEARLEIAHKHLKKVSRLTKNDLIISNLTQDFGRNPKFEVRLKEEPCDREKE